MVCPDPGKTFKTPSAVTTHRKMHTGERPFSCPDCGKSFGHKSTLIRHRSFHCSSKAGKVLVSPSTITLEAAEAQRSYKCGICQETYPSPNELKKHLRSHTGDQRYMCRECGRTFSCNYFLVRHQRTHTGERPFICPQCNKSFRCSSVLHRHQRTHSGEQPFKCEVCAKGFSQKTSLIIHLRTHTGERPFCCQICGRSFCSSSALIRHEQSHRHDGRWEGGDQLTAAGDGCIKIADSLPEDPIDMSFRTEGERDSGATEAPTMMREMTGRFTDVYSENSLQGDNGSEQVAAIVDPGGGAELWDTGQISEQDAASQGAREHWAPNTDTEQESEEKVVSAEGNASSAVTSSDYGKSFSSQSDLGVHPTRHSGNKPSCPDCGKTFGQRSSLTRHRNSHCSVRLGKRSINAGSFSSTISDHSGHKCGICHMTFPGLNELRRHLGSHKGDQRYMCHECGRIFSCNYFLVRHQRMHTGERPFICPQCNKGFRCSSVLQRHQRTHSGEQPYRCEVCTRCFSQKTSLIIHLRTHTGERPFCCQICGRSFCSSYALIRHEQSHRQYGSRATKGGVRHCDSGRSHVRRRMKKSEGGSSVRAAETTHWIEQQMDSDTLQGKLMVEIPGAGDHEHDAHYDTGDTDEAPLAECLVKPEDVSDENPLLNSAAEEQDGWRSDGHPCGDFLDGNDDGGGMICPDCGKTFESQSLLAVHQRTHSEDRPVTCSQCGKMFGHQSTLIRHQRSHCRNIGGLSLSDTSELSHKCGICNQDFPDTSELRRHLVDHKGEQRYTCKDCGHVFTCNYFLVRHQRTHTGEQPYKCKVCLRGFSQKTSLVIHVRTHTGERPYVCSVCPRGFCSRSALVRHEHSHRDRKSRRGERRGKMRKPVGRSCGKVQKFTPDRLSPDVSVDVTTSLTFSADMDRPGEDLVLDTKPETIIREELTDSTCNPGLRRCDINQSVESPDSWKPFQSPVHLAAHQAVERSFSCSNCSKSFGHRSTLIQHRNLHCNHKTGKVSNIHSQSGAQRFYKCGICQASCPSPNELKKHLRSHTGDQRYMCRECGRTFTCNFYLVRHQRMHTGERPFICPQCNKSFRCSSVLHRHQRTHSGEQPFKCEVCAKGFSQKTSLIIHLRTHTGERPFCCQICGRSFCSSSALIRHAQSHRWGRQGKHVTSNDTPENEAVRHPIKEEPACTEREDDEFPKTEGEVGQSCLEVVRVSVTELGHGIDQKHGDLGTEAITELGNTEETLKDLLVEHDEGTGFICPECGKFFQTQTLLGAHRKVHVAGRCLVCSDCGKSFGHRSSLLRHRSSHCSRQPGNGAAKPSAPVPPAQHFYKCGICHLNFSSSNELRRHLTSHKGNQRYMCRECGRTFSCNYFLVRHQRTHTGERPFICPQCNKSFRCISVLHRHQRTHSGEQPFKCEVCAKGFSQKTSLIIHLRTHTGERPFCCQICGRSFCSSSALIRHEQSHKNDSKSKDQVSDGEEMS